MATASVQHTFSALTDIKSSEANKNFSDLVNFINNQVIHADASRVFTAIPTGPPTDPSSDNQFARKAYVDRGPSVIQNELIPSGMSETLSGSFVNWPITGGQLVVSHTKRLASGVTNILVIYLGGGFSVTAIGSVAEYAVRVDAAGSDFTLNKFGFNTINEHHAHVGGQTITGLGVGAHNYGLRARRVSGAGGIRCDPNDRLQFIIMEVPV